MKTLPRKYDLTGQRFGYLVAVNPSNGGRAGWTCKCACGKKTFATTNYLLAGRKKSCGCQHQAMATLAKITHGLSKTPEYAIWKGMIKRCENKNSPDYPEYGGRGITVHPTWRADFAAFLSDVGTRPSKKHSIDRIENDLGYQPGNVRWSTPTEQSNNRRSRRWAVRPKDNQP